jgi:hypothetical protein
MSGYDNSMAYDEEELEEGELGEELEEEAQRALFNNSTSGADLLEEGEGAQRALFSGADLLEEGEGAQRALFDNSTSGADLLPPSPSSPSMFNSVSPIRTAASPKSSSYASPFASSSSFVDVSSPPLDQTTGFTKISGQVPYLDYGISQPSSRQAINKLKQRLGIVGGKRIKKTRKSKTRKSKTRKTKTRKTKTRKSKKNRKSKKSRK